MTTAQIREIAKNNANKLPKLTDNHISWLSKNIKPRQLFPSSKGNICPWCGKIVEKKFKCEHCGHIHNGVRENGRQHSDKWVFNTLHTFKGLQVIRAYEVTFRYRRGQSYRWYANEVAQLWFDEQFHTAVMSETIFIRRWGYSGLTPRKYLGQLAEEFLSWGWVYPNGNLLPQFKQYGLSVKFFNKALFPHFKFFKLATTNNKIETLLKVGGEVFLNLREREIEENWAEIKIALRHNYKLTEDNVKDWKDYVENLRTLEKDTHNPHYICPANLQDAHHRILQQVKTDKEKFDQKRYEQKKGRYFGILITDQKIDITPLKTIDEFIREGEYLHHCVGKNSYYNKDNSLILSARINGKPIETIEIDLKSFRILQCRGKFNNNSEHHDRIVNLMETNMDIIRKAEKAKTLVA